MEGFIIFLVIAGISFVINNFKRGDENKSENRKQMPPIGQGPTNKPKTMKSASGLGGYMKEIASELDKQFGEPKAKEIQKRVQKNAPRMQEVYHEAKESEMARQQVLQATKAKAVALQVERQKTLNKARHHSKTMKNSLVPSTKKGMAQAIIMSEILAPPISKRRR